MLENVIETVENCRYCLMCRHVAPVGMVTHLETLTPRGVALVAASQRRGLVEWDEESIGVVFSEVDGGNSRAHCVNDQPFEDAIAAVRAQLVKQELAPAVVYELHKKFEQWGNPYGELGAIGAGEAGETALFVSDEAATFDASSVEHVKSLLGAVGTDAVVIGGYNTGFMANSLGLPEQAKQLASRVQDEIKSAGAKRLLVLSPGDYYTFKQLYHERLGVTLPDDVELVEVTTLLAEKLIAGELKLNITGGDKTYAYVDPTHAVRVPERHDAPRQLLQAVTRAMPSELFWRRERAHPVGNTAIQFTQPALAEQLTRARLQDAQRTNADVLVTDDPATLHQLNRFAAEYDLETVSLYALVAQHIAT